MAVALAYHHMTWVHYMRLLLGRENPRASYSDLPNLLARLR